MTGALRTLTIRFRLFGTSATLSYLYYWLLIRVRRHVWRGLCKRSVHDYKMLLDPSDRGISTTLLLNGDREQQLGEILRRELAEADVVLDLGANIGYYALLEHSLVGEEGKIYALEPSPSNAALLRRNVELNSAGDVIEVFQLAGGAAVGTERFYLAQHSNLNTLVPSLADGNNAHGLSGEHIDVEVVDLPSFLVDKRPVDLLRMDIEGYEVAVLEGLEPAIKNGQFKGSILFECHFPRYDADKNNIREQLRMLFANGYRPKIMTSNDETRSPFGRRGYQPSSIVRTGLYHLQGLYYDIDSHDAEHFVCDTGGVRDILLVRTRDELAAPGFDD